MTWDPVHLPDLRGRSYAVTGGNAGIGYFAAEQLASAGASVILMSRSKDRLVAAEAALRGQVPDADVSSVVLDLASLASVRGAAAALSALPALDGIFLNGGPMLGARARTQDGFPLLAGTHPIANFALVAGVLDRLADTGTRRQRPSRIVHASTSFVHRWNLPVDDLLQQPKLGLRAYTQAKTATEMFAFELDRRLRAARLPVASIVTHPGVAADAKTPERPGVRDATRPYQRNPFTPWAQGKDAGAWPAVRALTDPDAVGGDYFGPANGARGLPVKAEKLSRTALPEPAIAHALWAQLSQLSGVDLHLPTSS
ncbi:SDR family NAD(P)-dependent oxidoreductase [Aeromicrobium phragmitis]|uniref:SDR family NAD(P)-dependent oxidoreductase n=1 Tax=Aeromicrobium phragmitis TaxID=2478914 RepID=A0A3L8PP44_9ACTN|nr:SDR family NAD(P)-dependent oxidoreductase [Aeromicrobium phragmitis]RLV57195.1 SDR family NAD(P)-dependent oxidoreductase [Aeromicrobium phragmitis]